MKNLLIIAIVAIGMLTSCKEKANTETETNDVQTTETAAPTEASADSIATAKQAEIDAAHGHSH